MIFIIISWHVWDCPSILPGLHMIMMWTMIVSANWCVLMHRPVRAAPPSASWFLPEIWWFGCSLLANCQALSKEPNQDSEQTCLLLLWTERISTCFILNYCWSNLKEWASFSECCIFTLQLSSSSVCSIKMEFTSITCFSRSAWHSERCVKDLSIQQFHF